MMKVQLRRGADLRDERGYYSYQGRRYPSVTTVLGPHSDFTFVHAAWIAGEVSRLAQDLTQDVDIWVEVEGEWVKKPTNALLALQDTNWIKGIGFRKLKEAADRGSVVHDILELCAEGADPSLEDAERMTEENVFGKRRACTVEDALPYVKSLLGWLGNHEVKVFIVEASIFNDTHEYAGRADLLCEIPSLGFYGWVDLKTNDSWKRSWGAQLAAYSKGDFAVVDDNIEYPIPQGLPCAQLMVTPDRVLFRKLEVGGKCAADKYFNEHFLPSLKSFNANSGLTLPDKATAWRVA